ncbi:cyclin-P3-1-like [Arachis stenosperma]|uniref:cyclin-P3-1-like n=1 Tax=Arachis stenosperma TaxID=217475 RepID=UPI0025AC60D8|nr:cyclin-P3-1-like [Arachis stenosperma]
MPTRSEAYKSLLQVEESSENGTLIPRALLILSSVWERSIKKNDKLVMMISSKNITVFHGSKAPKLSITRYMERILKYAGCSSSCFVIAQIYIDRYFSKNGGYLTSFNAHRLLITSLLVAVKFLDDRYFSNAYYAQVGGISTQEMNRMELEFLFSLEFRLFVTTEMFVKYCEKLDKVDNIGEYQIRRPIITSNAK